MLVLILSLLVAVLIPILGDAGNDDIDGGDGADVITGGTGQDDITGGAGNDTIIFTAITESAGANRDVMSDFVSGADNIRITHTLTKASFVLTDRGDVATNGDVSGVTSGNGTTGAGDAVFITDTDIFGIDFNADGIINANDFSMGITAIQHSLLMILICI